ncbi:MAG: hypothetical protein ACLPTZ_21235 [Beijerinckiaceae bacterium]
MPEQYDSRKLPVVVNMPVVPNFIRLPKPPSRTRYLGPIFWGCAGISIVLLTLNPHKAVEQPVELPGWTNLLPCSYAASFDGTKELSLSEDGRAVLYDKLAKGGSIDGNWIFDETSKLYTVTISGEIATYSVVEPGGAGFCMLVKGDPAAADLRSSWFSSPVDEGPDDDREHDTGL